MVMCKITFDLVQRKTNRQRNMQPKIRPEDWIEINLESQPYLEKRQKNMNFAISPDLLPFGIQEDAVGKGKFNFSGPAA